MVTTGVYHVTYNGDGSTTEFAFTFPYDSSDDIVVVLVDADGEETILTSDYYVNTVNNTVTYPGYAPGSEPAEADQPAVLTSDEQIVIYRSTPITQESDLGEKWPFATIENGLDKLTMILQETSYEVGCALRVSDATAETAGDDLDLEIPIEAGKTIVGNDTSTGYETATALLLDEDDGVWDANSIPVSNLPTPTNSTDATNKEYVDGLMSDEVLRNIDATYDDADLDAFTTCGVYFVRRSSTSINTDSWTDDLASAANGFLTVLTTTDDATRVKQIFRRWGTLNSNDFMVYQRSYMGGTWGRWTRIDGNNENVKFYFNPQGDDTTDSGETTTQGECNIIIAYDKVIMIDCGAANKSTWIQNWLVNTLGITKIDYLIISHYHGDHVNGLSYYDDDSSSYVDIMTYLDWSECTAYLPVLPPSDVTGYSAAAIRKGAVEQFLTNYGATIVYPDEGDVVTISSSFSFTFYNANVNTDIYDYQTNYIADEDDDYTHGYNDYSMVVRVDHRNMSVVYSGDINRASQKRMYDNGFYTNVNVYKMHHHGYNYTGYVPYCNAVNPNIIINQNHIDYINDLVIHTDLRYFVDKTMLMPMDSQVLLTSDGSDITVTEGPEVYPWKNRHVMNLGASCERILSGDDLDNYIMGTYTITSGTVMSAISNTPSDWSYGNARLICIYNQHTGYTAENGYVTQILIGSNTNGIIYMRTRQSTTWTSWVKVLTSADTSTLVTAEVSSSVSVSANTVKNIASVSVAAGTWMVTGHVNFTSTTAGGRYTMNVYKNSDSMSVAGDGTVSNIAVNGGDEIAMQTSKIMQYSSSGTIYLNVYATVSGTVAAADIKAVRLG